MGNKSSNNSSDGDNAGEKTPESYQEALLQPSESSPVKSTTTTPASPEQRRSQRDDSSMASSSPFAKESPHTPSTQRRIIKARKPSMDNTPLTDSHEFVKVDNASNKFTGTESEIIDAEDRKKETARETRAQQQLQHARKHREKTFQERRHSTHTNDAPKPQANPMSRFLSAFAMEQRTSKRHLETPSINSRGRGVVAAEGSDERVHDDDDLEPEEKRLRASESILVDDDDDGGSNNALWRPTAFWTGVAFFVVLAATIALRATKRYKK